MVNRGPCRSWLSLVLIQSYLHLLYAGLCPLSSESLEIASCKKFTFSRSRLWHVKIHADVHSDDIASWMCMRSCHRYIGQPRQSSRRTKKTFERVGEQERCPCLLTVQLLPAVFPLVTCFHLIGKALAGSQGCTRLIWIGGVLCLFVFSVTACVLRSVHMLVPFCSEYGSRCLPTVTLRVDFARLLLVGSLSLPCAPHYDTL